MNRKPPRILGFLFLSQIAYAFEVTDLSIEYKQIGVGSEIYELPPERKPMAEFNLNLDINVIGTIYWRNQVRSYISPGAFSLIGWKFEIGANLHPNIQIYVQHFSQHQLDGVYPDSRPHFPVYDSVGIRIKLI